MAFSHGYGDTPSEEYAIDAIRSAHDFGCTFFDTAEGYGAQQYFAGHNERIVGKAVAPFRKDIVIATKFMFGGEACDGAEQAAEIIRRHIMQSLKNLGTDYIDLYYLHRVSRQIPVETVAAAMRTFIDEGLIRGWGLSQVSGETLRRAHEVTPVSAVQNIYSMVERDCEKEVFPYAQSHGIGVVPFSPVASGLLSGRVNAQTDFSHADDVRKFVPQLSQQNINANKPLLDLLSDFAAKKNATMAQISLSWMLAKYPNVVPIPGSRNKGRILENLGSWSVTLSPSEFDSLDTALNAIQIHGHRGIEEFEGDTMRQWNREKQQ